VAIPAWQDLAGMHQEYLLEVNVQSPADPAAVGDKLALDISERERCFERLKASGYIRERQDRLEPAELVPASVLAEIADNRRKLRGATAQPTRRRRSYDTARCGHWMPRAKAECVLRLGHRGAHRSYR